MDSRNNVHHSADVLLQRTPRALPSKSLYVSHFLSTWNSRAFEFGAVLFLAAIYPGTLMLMSVYALLRAAATILFSHRIGWFIDTQERLRVVRISIIGQRLAVFVSCWGFLYLLTDSHIESSTLSRLVFGLLLILACVEKLCSVMNTVAIERDWVVVIAADDEPLLQELNSQMRRIDLFCKLVAPLGVALLDGVSTRLALLVVMVLNICSMAVEYPFIARVYNKTPALAQRIASPAPEYDAEEGPQPLERTISLTESLRARQTTIFALVKTYVSSAAFLPSLALSMLYLTVLSFSGQMTTFLLAVPQPKMTSTTLGLLRTVSTVFEISATFIAPRIMAAIGPVRAGIWCLSWQYLCLSLGVGCLWLAQISDSTKPIMFFIAAVILSRVGLWCFDLVAQLLIQNSIDSSHRGSFSSAEAALQNFFELCTFAMTIVFPNPIDFKYPALASLVATYCSAALYAKFVRDRRGHLLHMPLCLKRVGGGRYELVEAIDAESEIESGSH